MEVPSMLDTLRMELSTCPVALQFVLDSHDAVQVTYSDDSVLQISPCGSVMAHSTPKGPLHGCDVIKQRVEFVTSSFREKVTEAITFRNRFAERPYLVTSICKPSQCIPDHRNDLSIAWPSVIDQAGFEQMPDHSVMLNSLDRRASLTLTPCRKLVTLRYLCQVRGSDPNSSDSDKDKGAPFSWVVQHHSIFNRPLFLKHPINLLLLFVQQEDAKERALEQTPGPHVRFEGDDTYQSKNITDEEKLEVDQMDKLKGYVCSELPQSLPSSCHKQHLHKWKDLESQNSDEHSSFSGHIKALCYNGILYRLFWSNPKAVEVYPGDGSILRSKGLAGHYFQHFLRLDGKVEEKLFSLKCLPPNRPGQAYSVGKILSTASQLLDLLCASHAAPEDKCCWRTEDACSVSLAPSPFTLETISVEGLGKFSAQSSGLIRVVFTDRTCLEMWADVSQRVSNFLKNTDVEVSEEVLRPVPSSICTLLLPSGHYQKVSLDAPGPHIKYVEPALEWLRWVNTPPKDRKSFYQDTIFDPGCSTLVTAELNKIKCFNYLVDHHPFTQCRPHLNETQTSMESQSDVLAPSLAELTSASDLPMLSPHPPDTPLDMAAVQRALNATSAAINDLDSFISSSRNKPS